MKVRVTLTLEVDRKAWSLAYGTGTVESDVREDVRSYVHNAIAQSAAAEEDAITGVTLA